MAKVHICNVVVLDNPSPFLNPFQFEITFDCIEDLQEDLEWRIIYVGSAECEELDQVLDTVYVGPVSVGRHMFVFQAEPPDPLKIPEADVVGVTVVLLTCSYRGQEFMRVGYYVNNEYKEPNLRDNPPPHPLFDKLHRNLLATKPHVTHFKIEWDNAGGPKSTLTTDGEPVCDSGALGATVLEPKPIQETWDGSCAELKASQTSKGPPECLLRFGEPES
ncbi:histone chaperone ASF1-like isoform X2 [Ischnura elegans]|uniref:histone chaperone ASF1-like isoform X2 n=1 Tax=Ischnura elegans TaxID=197161 RepID=UPI001ED8BF95|nr:histone chaperone ASF1-like isoform X2 [Ischnura elegans]